MENWMRSKRFPNYEMGSEGNIKNVKTGRILNTYTDGHGYRQLTLYKDKKPHNVKVHREILEAFTEGNHDGLDVNHIDGDKSNNCIDNLEWCTRKENIAHAFATGLAKTTESKKVKVRVVETGIIYDSLVACSNAIDGDRNQIRRCLQGKEKSCKGLHFEKVN